ncbi:MAG: hypothetical protein C4343_02840 [Chloroflexota bacterium]
MDALVGGVPGPEHPGDHLEVVTEGVEALLAATRHVRLGHMAWASAPRIVNDSRVISSVGSGHRVEAIEDPQRLEAEPLGGGEFERPRPGGGRSQPAYSHCHRWGAIRPTFTCTPSLGDDSETIGLRSRRAAVAIDVAAGGRPHSPPRPVPCIMAR